MTFMRAFVWGWDEKEGACHLEHLDISLFRYYKTKRVLHINCYNLTSVFIFRNDTKILKRNKAS